MPGAEFEPAVPESEWPQSHALYRAAARFGVVRPETKVFL